MYRTATALMVCLCSGSCLFPMHAGEIRGVVHVIGGLTKKRVALPGYQMRGGSPPPPNGEVIDELSRVFVYLEGEVGALKPVTAVLTQRDRRFEPEIVAVPQGSTVSFPNGDPIFHNVFSLSKPKSFDLGSYPLGSARTVRFDHPGAVQVYCHLHSDMSALILVTPNQYYTQPSSDGAFKLVGVPTGSYSIVAWHKSAKPVRKNIEVKEDGVAEVVFTIPEDELASHK